MCKCHTLFKSVRRCPQICSLPVCPSMTLQPIGKLLLSNGSVHYPDETRLFVRMGLPVAAAIKFSMRPQHIQTPKRFFVPKPALLILLALSAHGLFSSWCLSAGPWASGERNMWRALIFSKMVKLTWNSTHAALTFSVPARSEKFKGVPGWRRKSSLTISWTIACSQLKRLLPARKVFALPKSRLSSQNLRLCPSSCVLAKTLAMIHIIWEGSWCYNIYIQQRPRSFSLHLPSAFVSKRSLAINWKCLGLIPSSCAWKGALKNEKHQGAFRCLVSKRIYEGFVGCNARSCKSFVNFGLLLMDLGRKIFARRILIEGVQLKKCVVSRDLPR